MTALDRPPGKTVKRFCEHCGGIFYLDAYAAKHDAGRFCRPECYWITKKGKALRSLEERFWEKVDKAGPIMRPELGACWIFGKGNGYGSFYIGGDRHNRPAHQVSWELANGPIPEGQFPCHKCDNPPCIRPDHLFLGTTLENNQDMAQKGRSKKGKHYTGNYKKGEAHKHAKLTEDRVRQMRIDYRPGSGIRLIDLAQREGISLTLAFKIIHRKSWAHVV